MSEDDSALVYSRKLFMEYKIAVKTNMESMGIRNQFFNSNTKINVSFEEFKKLKILEVPANAVFPDKQSNQPQGKVFRDAMYIKSNYKNRFMCSVYERKATLIDKEFKQALTRS